MFELHMSDGLTVESSTVQSPLLVLGSIGQGKTVFLLQLILELIRNHQSGLIYDPYGDLVKKNRSACTISCNASENFFNISGFIR